MPKENKEGANAELAETIRNHSEKISRLNQRISDISDEIAILKTDLNGFKKGVARDMRSIIDTIKNKE